MRTKKNGSATAPKAAKLSPALAAIVDELWTTREKRLKIFKTAEDLKKKETDLRAEIVAELGKAKASGISGKKARVELVSKTVPDVVDWDSLYKHIVKTKSFDLLGRSVSRTAVAERWEAGKAIPGVESTTFAELSLKKV